MREPMYIIRCQPTEILELYFFAGVSDTGKALFSKELDDAKRYSSMTDAEQVARPLWTSREMIRYIIEPEYIQWN